MTGNENIEVSEINLPDMSDFKLDKNPEKRKKQIAFIKGFVEKLKDDPNQLLDFFFNGKVENAKKFYEDIRSDALQTSSVSDLWLLVSDERRKTYNENEISFNKIKNQLLPLISDYIMFKLYGTESFGGSHIIYLSENNFKNNLLHADFATDRSSLINTLRFLNILVCGQDDGQAMNLSDTFLSDTLQTLCSSRFEGSLTKKQEAVLDEFFTGGTGKFDPKQASDFVTNLTSSVNSVSLNGDLISSLNTALLKKTFTQNIIPMMNSYINNKSMPDDLILANLDKKLFDIQ